jgi:hypothetical protein
MKKTLFYLITCALILTSCLKEKLDFKPCADVQELNLYWDHEIFGEGGRKLRFDLTQAQECLRKYKLVFEYEIQDETILITLTDRIDQGDCPKFPSPSGTIDMCRGRGRFSIPEDQLVKDHYSVVLKFNGFEVTSMLLVEDDKFHLEIPPNEKLSSTTKEVFPIPKNLLLGSLSFRGVDKIPLAQAYYTALDSIGLVPTTIPNYPYRYLKVDSTGSPINRETSEERFVWRFLYQMNVDFKTIYETSKNYFEKTELDIYLYSSQGDEARLSKKGNNYVVYAE